MPIEILLGVYLMSINGISSFSLSGGGSDPELIAIMRQLRKYGIIPTGIKSTDKATLRRIEIQKAEQETTATGKFITVSRNEENKIQENKKTKKKENNFNSKKDFEKTEKAMKTMGEQIYLAIKMKQKRKT